MEPFRTGLARDKRTPSSADSGYFTVLPCALSIASGSIASSLEAGSLVGLSSRWVEFADEHARVAVLVTGHWSPQRWHSKLPRTHPDPASQVVDEVCGSLRSFVKSAVGGGIYRLGSDDIAVPVDPHT